MKTYFDGLRKVEKSEFLSQFHMHLENRQKLDPTEEQIFKRLETFESLTCFSGVLNETGKCNLILPHHSVELEPNRNPDRPVKVGGQELQTVIRDYIECYIPNSRFPKCVGKIYAQQSRFFRDNDSILKAGFLFVSNCKEYAHPGDDHYNNDHGENKIYIGNGFHRFIAYGLWITQNGFKPLEVYYVQ